MPEERSNECGVGGVGEGTTASSTVVHTHLYPQVPLMAMETLRSGWRFRHACYRPGSGVMAQEPLFSMRVFSIDGESCEETMCAGCRTFRAKNLPVCTQLHPFCRRLERWAILEGGSVRGSIPISVQAGAGS